MANEREGDEYVGRCVWYAYLYLPDAVLADNLVHRIVEVRHAENPAGSDGLEFYLPHGKGPGEYITDWSAEGCPLTQTGPTPPPGRPLCPICFPEDQQGPMDEKRIRTILEQLWPGIPMEKSMVLAMCLHGASVDTSKEALVAAAKEISFEFKPSTPSDDDAYWLARSPFDGKWYTFAALGAGGGWPQTPVYIDDDRPPRFDEN